MNQFALDRSAELALWIDDVGRCVYATKPMLDILEMNVREIATHRICDFDPRWDRLAWAYFFKQLKRRDGVTRPSFCTTASERVYITALGCETEFGGT